MLSTSTSSDIIEPTAILDEKFPDHFEYMPEDSYYNPTTKLFCCNKCNTPKQCVIKWMGIERKVICQCDCEEKADKAEKEETERRNAEIRKRHNRSEGIRGRLHDKRFADLDVDNENKSVIKICQKYMNKFEEMYRDNIGLKLFGSKGFGKSVIAACIANELIDKGYRVYMRTMDELINSVQASYDKNTVIEEICSYDLLIIDEFGSERGTETAVQYVYDIINARLNSNKPFIVTTNISKPSEELMNIEQKRIYSRFDEAMVPIRCEGRDRRTDIGADKTKILAKLLED